jgi:cystathionine beta-lyase/cystathionine gamma-synthase
MHRKGSMELSVNSIVILVIAIVIMGLILAFVRSKFNDVTKGLEQDEPVPATASSSSPIELSRTTIAISPGSTAVIKASIYNPTTTDATDVKPKITGCDAIADTTGSSKNIKAAEAVQYSLILKVPSNKAKNVYLCQIQVEGIADITPKDIVIKVE